MKKKTIMIICGVLLAAVLAFGVVPVAADAVNANQTTPAAQQVHKGQILLRLLAIQDEAKVDALLATAVSSNKITADQSAKIKAFWTAHHAQFIKARIVGRLMKVKDGAKLDAFLANAVSSGKITQAQSDQIQALWTELHTA
jgi:predicted butyrate kinase (DUF1464 family)